jgi:hypothetical protein
MADAAAELEEKRRYLARWDVLAKCNHLDYDPNDDAEACQ